MKLLFLLALSTASAAVSAQDEPQPWQVVRGVTIGAAGTPITAIPAAIADTEGRLFVAQPITHDVAVFGPGGQLLYRIGRRGRGPGEFERISTLGWLADTLWVMDRRQGRTTLFDRRGNVLATLRHPVQLQVGEGWRALPSAYLLGGTVLSIPGVSQAAFSQPDPPPVPVLLASRQGEVLDTIAWQAVAGRALSLRAPNGTAILSSYQPFSEVAIPAADPSGRRVIIVDRASADEARTGYFRVTAIAANGRAEWARVFRYTPTALPRTVSDSIVRQATMEFRDAFGSAGAAERALRAGLHLPKFVPPVTVAVVGSDGTIWLRREDIGQPRVAWLVLDDKGRQLASLTLPRGSDIKAARRNSVWAVEHDADDVPLLVRYDVRRVP